MRDLDAEARDECDAEWEVFDDADSEQASTHTPGSWSWTYSDKECQRPIALDNGKTDVILCSEDFDGPRGYINDADARLIASAPDLLAACKALLAETAVWEDEHGIHPAAVLARAAIAKAEPNPIT
jgi:hypothetical protein